MTAVTHGATPFAGTLPTVFRRALTGTLTLAVSELDMSAMPEARVVVYTPRDDDTRAKMPLTRRAAPAAPVRRPGGRTRPGQLRK